MNKVIGHLDARQEEVHLWGAGFSGLILGYYLKQRGFKVTIYEKSDRIGGKIGTGKNNLGLFETGANAFYMNADSMDLFKELKLDVLPATKNLKRFIFLDGHFKKPLSVSLVSKIFFNILRKPPLISEGLTVEEFFRPLLGDYYTKNYLSAALSGIYSISADKLHFKSVFGHITQHESLTQFGSYRSFFATFFKQKRKGPKLEIKGSVSFDGGMQPLIDKLGENLRNEIRLSYSRPFQLKTNTIICTDALVAADLLSAFRPEVSKELQRIQYAPLSTSTFFLKKEIKELNQSFGALIPKREEIKSIGLLNNKHIFPSNNQNIYSYTLITPGKISKDELIEDLSQICSSFQKDDVDELEQTYWEKGLPLYDLQRYLAIKKLHQILGRENGLLLFGNYVAGISLREMTSAARSFANSL